MFFKLHTKRLKEEDGTRSRSSLLTPNTHTLHSHRGFTLIELMVTVGIFATISSIILARNSTFDNEVLLNDLAYDVALSIREAQQYGINVRASEGLFDRPYGIYFQKNTTTYYEFADRDNDGVYDAPGELVKTFTLGRGAIVQTLCNLSASNCTLTDLTVLFKRPDPDAILNQGAFSRARIELLSVRGGIRYVVVEATGQISIQKP